MNLLDKYTDTIKKIEQISNEITMLQKITNMRILKEPSGEKRREIYCDFLEYIEQIRKNKNIRERYKKLRKREMILYKKISKIMTHNEEKNICDKVYLSDDDKKYKKKYNDTVDNTVDNTECTEDEKINKINNRLYSIIDKYKKLSKLASSNVSSNVPSKNKKHNKTKYSVLVSSDAEKNKYSKKYNNKKHDNKKHNNNKHNSKKHNSRKYSKYESKKMRNIIDSSENNNKRKSKKHKEEKRLLELTRKLNNVSSCSDTDEKKIAELKNLLRKIKKLRK